MLTGLIFVVLGVLVLLYPHILVFFFASLLILFGLATMAAGYQFRRMKRASSSRFISWIARW